MVMGVLTLAQAKKSRLVEFFEQHCRRHVSEAHIPGMVAPAMERRTFLGEADETIEGGNSASSATSDAP
jgi:hypothetical protein